MAAITLPDNITPEDFQSALDRYDQIIEKISALKGGESEYTQMLLLALIRRQPSLVSKHWQSWTATGTPKHRRCSPSSSLIGLCNFKT